MVSLDNAVTARLKKGSKEFEILVDPEGGLAFKRGEITDISKILAVECIFENASRGDRIAESDIAAAFQTGDVLKIAAVILEQGELQLTKEQRKRFLEEKRRLVVTFIAQNAINPQTMAPHPPQRIEIAMEEAKVNIDPMKSVDELVTITMKAIRPLIPIRFEEVNVAVKIPALYAPKAFGDVSNFGKMVKNGWQSDGSWIAVIRIPAGMQTDFYALLNHLTKGEAETKLLRDDPPQKK
jgi:ribosome maturation protein SDO1